MGFSGTVTFGGSDPWLSVDLNAIAFSVGSLHIRWYGIFIALGVLLALAYASHYAKQFGVDFFTAAVICLIASFVKMREVSYWGWFLMAVQVAFIAVFVIVLSAVVFYRKQTMYLLKQGRKKG